MRKSIFEVHWSRSTLGVVDSFTSVETAGAPFGPSAKLFISNRSPMIMMMPLSWIPVYFASLSVTRAQDHELMISGRMSEWMRREKIYTQLEMMYLYCSERLCMCVCLGFRRTRQGFKTRCRDWCCCCWNAWADREGRWWELAAFGRQRVRVGRWWWWGERRCFSTGDLKLGFFPLLLSCRQCVCVCVCYCFPVRSSGGVYTTRNTGKRLCACVCNVYERFQRTSAWSNISSSSGSGFGLLSPSIPLPLSAPSVFITFLI